MQVFYWLGPGRQTPGKVHYNSFMLNSQIYNVGDCVYLYPEDEHSPHFVGRIVSAFVDETAPESDPHRIEVKWYERRTSFEPSTRGILESEREVFELEDTDINPIGCISGKNVIVRAPGFDEARQAMSSMPDMDWFFCRGYFLQASNSFKSYTQEELDTYAREHAAAAAALAAPATKGGTPGSAAAAAGVPGGGMATRGQQQKEAQAEPKEGGAKDAASPPASAPAKRGRKPSAVSAEKAAAGKAPAKVSRPGPQKRRVAVVGTGVCVQCGATSTPQWREGPEGPKTLCNACGVRHVRQQQKKKNGGAGAASSQRAKPGPKGPIGAAVATAAAAAVSQPASQSQPALQVQTRRGRPPESSRAENLAMPASKRRRGGDADSTASEEQKPSSAKQEARTAHRQRGRQGQEQQQVKQEEQEEDEQQQEPEEQDPALSIEEATPEQRRLQVVAAREVLQLSAKYAPLQGPEQRLLEALENASDSLLEQTAELVELVGVRDKLAQALKEADAAEAAVEAVLKVYKDRQSQAQEAVQAASDASSAFRLHLSKVLKQHMQPSDGPNAAGGADCDGVQEVARDSDPPAGGEPGAGSGKQADSPPVAEAGGNHSGDAEMRDVGGGQGAAEGEGKANGEGLPKGDKEAEGTERQPNGTQVHTKAPS